MIGGGFHMKCHVKGCKKPYVALHIAKKMIEKGLPITCWEHDPKRKDIEALYNNKQAITCSS